MSTENSIATIALPKHWAAWSAAEQDAWEDALLERAAQSVAWEALQAFLPAGVVQLALEVEATMNAVTAAHDRLLCARLARLIPHFADVIAATFDVAATWELTDREPAV